MTETAKEIALEILEKYLSSESFIIADRSLNQTKDYAELDAEAEKYRNRIKESI